MLQLDSPVLKSHLKSRLSLLDVPLARPTSVDILVGSGLPNLDLDFVEIGFCFLAAGRVAGRVVCRVAGLGVLVDVVLLVVLLVKTGAGAAVVVEVGFLCGARGMLGLARVVLEPAGTEW